ncbi:uncharacterized protein LOC135847566 [Planococcus citri]|uniref:uncharacterized protein LOC135847566 n=1 Tax=Planococcus citri TaxID=170843 RepID=UPI0031F7E404
MSFSDDVRLKAQSALKPYLEGDYSSSSQHAVSCHIGDLLTIGKGTTNKIAKTEAAQQVVDLLLKPVDVSRLRESVNGVGVAVASVTSWSSASDLHLQTSARSFDNTSCDSTRVLQDRVPTSNTEYQMANCISNGKSRFDHTRTVEPQMDLSGQVRARPQSVVLPENIAHRKSETPDKVSVTTLKPAPQPSLSTKRSKRKSNKRSKHLLRGNSSAAAQVYPSYEDFFNPFFRQQDKSKLRNKVSANATKSTSAPPSTLQSSKASEGTFLANTCSNAPEKPSGDSFFDPFFKQRPPNSNSASIMETDSLEDLVKNQNNLSNRDDTKVNTMESKNVFALLQKKTQKHLKLIPRFRIEDTESGFRCNVQLGSYYASGEGKNKKEAKTKAAVSLLNQVNDVN